ncbi:hypothetical protein QY97_02436 [Bacillus thermotolerans]|nr:hypothetical protein QY97_02436 [Bacillus thermotolerans]
MRRVRAWMKVISILSSIGIAWFFLFGVRLSGYFSAISEKGLQAVQCGTQGCSSITLF